MMAVRGALLAGMLILILREIRPVLALPVRLAATVLLFAGGLALLPPILARIKALFALAGDESYAALALGAVGIALATEFGASFCRDLGEPGLGEALLFFGRIELLLLTLPLLDSLLDMARELLSW